jgi:putative serine protease PepD
MRTPRPLVVVAVSAILGGAAGTGVAVGFRDDGSNTTTTTAQAVTPTAQRSTTALTASQIYQRSINSVATITARSSGGVATGTGFVVSATGHIVTNEHVIDGAGDITVKLGDGSSQRASVVGQDRSSDLALLKINAGGHKLTPLTFADSSKAQIGDATFAIGNPFGLDGTLTTGVISATDRDIQAPNGFSISGVLQTDAALNPGNSGGPLLDDRGQVIGVNSQIESDSTDGSSQGGNVGIGFAVPSNTVRQVISALEEGVQVPHAYLGVSASDAGSSGATVASVSSSGPAAGSGLRRGDVITAVGDTTIGSSADLSAAINARVPSNRVTLTVHRGGKTITASVKLGKRPSTAPTG